MAITVLENPVLFGMRLGAELDQLRQSAMAQAISQSLREALDLHTWRYGMIANLLAAYHRAQSPAERAAYAALIEPLAEAAQEPKELKMVVPGVGVRIDYLPMTAVRQILGRRVVQNQTAPQGQQGGSTQSNQLQPAEQQTTAPQTATTTQPAETRKLTREQLQAVLEALAFVDPLYGLVHHRLRPPAQQTAAPEQQTEGAAQPMQQQPVEQQGTQQTQGTLGGILQQKPDQQQFQEYTYEPTQIQDWSRAVQEAQDKVLPQVFFWYPLVKNDPRWRQALSGIMQLDLERMAERQRRYP